MACFTAVFTSVTLTLLFATLAVAKPGNLDRIFNDRNGIQRRSVGNSSENAQPLNNTCDDPYDLGNVTGAVADFVFGNSTSASDLLENASCAVARGHDVVFKFVIPDGQSAIYLFTVRAEFDTVLVLSNNTCGYAAAIKCNDDYPGLGTGSRLAGALSGGTYYLAIDGFAAKSFGAFVLTYAFNLTTPQPFNNDCRHPADFGVIDAQLEGGVFGDSSSAVNNLKNANCSAALGPEVVFSFTIPEGSEWLYAFIATGDYDTVLVLLSASCGSYSRTNTLNCNDNFDRTNPGGSFIVGFVGAGQYFLVLDGASRNSSGHFVLEYHFLPPSNGSSSGSGGSSSTSTASGSGSSFTSLSSQSNGGGSSFTSSGGFTSGSSGSSFASLSSQSTGGSSSQANALKLAEVDPAGASGAGIGSSLTALMTVLVALLTLMMMMW